MKRKNPVGLDRGEIVEQLYDIALDPGSLDAFMDAWNGAGLDAQSVRHAINGIGTFDDAYSAHLKRAETFLSRGAEEPPELSELLAPFGNLAAMIVDPSLGVVACNDGAGLSYGLAVGQSLKDLQATADVQGLLLDSIEDLFQDASKPDRFLSLEIGTEPVETLFQIHRLVQNDKSGRSLALIVTTQYHWQPVVGQTLQEVFQLTVAEQGVVQALAEGRDAKAIATVRGTSEGTVRSQIKSILSKMNAKSQSEVIRLVLSLRDISPGSLVETHDDTTKTTKVVDDWLEAEVWKPFQTLTLPDGRRLDYHDMGPRTGAPVLYSHMGYCMARWTRPMLKLAFKHSLRIICPIRAGYGQSSNIDLKASVSVSTRNDTLLLLEHLNIKRLPYLTQGSDLIFAADLAAQRPDVVSEIIGLGARPGLPHDRHYAGMDKWHRFFLSTARHAPHLLNFTTKAAMSMGRRIGAPEMLRRMNGKSPADIALLDDTECLPVLLANSQLVVSKVANIAQAYTMEILDAETDWSDMMYAARETPTWFVNGLEDPSMDSANIAEYREHFPWIPIEVVSDAGQLLIYQKFDDLIPRIASAAMACAKSIE